MKRAWARWVAFLDEPEAPDTLAAVRIAFGAALVANVLVQMLVDDPVLLCADPRDGGVFDFTAPRDLSLFRLFPPTPAACWALLGVQLAAALALAAGAFARAAALVAWAVQVTLLDRMVLYRYDGDNVFRVVLFLLAVVPAGAAWSVDAWRGRGRATVPAWGRRLLLAQLVIIYVRTGVVKLGSTWSFLDGWQAVYLAMNLPMISRWPGDWAAHPAVFRLTQVGTFVVSWWEVLFFLLPVNMFLRRRPAAARRGVLRRAWARHDLRAPFLLVGAGMHAGIFVLTDVGLFSVVMLSLYPAALHPAEARRALGWCRARLPLPRRAAALGQPGGV